MHEEKERRKPAGNTLFALLSLHVLLAQAHIQRSWMLLLLLFSAQPRAKKAAPQSSKGGTTTKKKTETSKENQRRCTEVTKGGYA
jgi:hypothetical protein